MDIIVTTTAKTDDEARELLRLFGFPFPQLKLPKKSRPRERVLQLRRELKSMAKLSSINKNERRKKLVKKYAANMRS
jgi:hypothetical protein